MLTLNRSKVAAVVVVALSLLSGCATSPKINPVQVGDNQLNKDQITSEIAKLDQTQRQIDSNKGFTGTNVASVLFFWPGIVYTYYDASKATDLVNERRSHLTSLYNQKMSQQGKAKSTTNRNI